MLVMSVLFTTVYSGVALNTDLTKGVVDRFRSLPIWRPAPLLGSLLGDSVRYVIAGTVIIVLGVVLGYRPDGGVLGGPPALAWWSCSRSGCRGCSRCSGWSCARPTR
jgi:ABC-2 type transport system permease protein